jgi:hypothetical protein
MVQVTRTRFKASSQAFLRSDTFAVLTLMTSRSSSVMIMLSGPGGGGCSPSLDRDRDRVAEPLSLAAAGDELRFAPPLAACFRVRGIDFLLPVWLARPTNDAGIEEIG